MNILYIHPLNVGALGGAEVFIVEISKRLKLRGHNVGVLHTRWSPYERVAKQNFIELMKYNVELYECDYFKFPRGLPVIKPSCLLRISKHYDLLYVSAHSPNELVVHTLNKVGNLNKPIVAVFHVMIEPHRYILHKLYLAPFIMACKSFDKLQVFNKYVYNFFVKYYRINKEKVELIPNGVDASFYRLIPKYFEQNNKFVVLYVSRFTSEKGVDIFHKVVSTFNERYSELRRAVIFKVAGAGPLKHYVEKLANKYDNVVYLGYLGKEQLLAEYNSAHILIMTSRAENMPLTLLEASACGLPTVASAVPGVVDVVETLGYGILVKPGNIEGYVKGILYFYNTWSKNPEKYYDMRVSIRERTVANYDWNIIIDRIENMFRQVLTDKEHKF
mgnify:CR=1 FL=1